MQEFLKERHYPRMIRSIKRSWKELKQGRPGHRFQDRTEKSRRNRGNQSWVRRFLTPFIAIVLIAGGIILCVIPGPGLPLIFIGAALLAERSRTLARGLDWLEVKTRKAASWALAWWKHAPGAARFAVVVIGMAALAGAGYGAYRVTFGE